MSRPWSLRAIGGVGQLPITVHRISQMFANGINKKVPGSLTPPALYKHSFAQLVCLSLYLAAPSFMLFASSSAAFVRSALVTAERLASPKPLMFTFMEEPGVVSTIA